MVLDEVLDRKLQYENKRKCVVKEPEKNEKKQEKMNYKNMNNNFIVFVYKNWIKLTDFSLAVVYSFVVFLFIFLLSPKKTCRLFLY